MQCSGTERIPCPICRAGILQGVMRGSEAGWECCCTVHARQQHGWEWEALRTLLHNDQVEHRQVLRHDAAAHALPAALALPAAKASETGVARLHQQRHAAGRQHALLHAKALLVLASHDLEDIPLILLHVACESMNTGYRAGALL